LFCGAPEKKNTYFVFGKRVSKVNNAKRINKVKHVGERAKSAPGPTQEQPEVVGNLRAKKINNAIFLFKKKEKNVDLVYLVSKNQNKAKQGKQFTWFGVIVEVFRCWGDGLSLLVLGCWSKSSGFRVMLLVLG